ncbi:hypothetical protein N7450_002056 [Penicillium hetheringtonii]|uniref:Uncharacterized protein n=1 Tax=Penicillium hetheringtonii TaxID=911720 RepID=A0AAD6H200_9EURO|nr:hypothetical protein N7450_002056 [Penicillium hetheringtonii]
MSSGIATAKLAEEKPRNTSYGPTISIVSGVPSQVWREEPIAITVKVVFSNSEKIHPDTHFALNISLRDSQDHKYVNGLHGPLTTCLESFMNDIGQSTGVFKSIAIHKVGCFRLRVLLAASSWSQTTVKARADSDVIEVIECKNVVRPTLPLF